MLNPGNPANAYPRRRNALSQWLAHSLLTEFDFPLHRFRRDDVVVAMPKAVFPLTHLPGSCT